MTKFLGITMDTETAEIFRQICFDSRVSMSSVINVLVDDFLEQHSIADIVNRAQKMRKAGRPKRTEEDIL